MYRFVTNHIQSQESAVVCMQPPTVNEGVPVSPVLPFFSSFLVLLFLNVHMYVLADLILGFYLSKKT